MQTGQLHTYLAAIPVISSTWGTTLAYCTSLQELAVMDVMTKGSQRRITIPTEPAFLAIGPHHLAVGMNNKVCCTKHWHHDVLPRDNEQVSLSMIYHMTDMNVIISVLCFGTVINEMLGSEHKLLLWNGREQAQKVASIQYQSPAVLREHNRL